MVLDDEIALSGLIAEQARTVNASRIREKALTTICGLKPRD